MVSTVESMVDRGVSLGNRLCAICDSLALFCDGRTFQERDPKQSRYFSHAILISFSSRLKSGSPVMNSAFLSFASAAAKASA